MLRQHGLRHVKARIRPRPPPCRRPRPRGLLTLAIETSCDDTSVALVEKSTCATTKRTVAQLLFHKKSTADNAAFNGVHPLVALASHQENLANLVAEAIQNLPRRRLEGKSRAEGHGGERHAELPLARDTVKQRLPDFIAVTRGPGMRSNLSTGLDTAKGLAVAWQVPLVGVHHMQAHALTIRLVDALSFEVEEHGLELEEPWNPINVQPEFPFLSVLASGGHTLLIHSASLTKHGIVASTSDIAIGECLDKIARVVLPADLLQNAGTTMYGALLEAFAFPAPNTITRPGPTSASTPSDPSSTATTYALDINTAAEYRSKYRSHYSYCPPKNHEEAAKRNVSKWGWGFNQPLVRAQGGLKTKSMEMSFSGLTTAVERAVKYQPDAPSGKLTKIERPPNDISLNERRDLAHHAMRTAFEHLAGRVVLGLQHSLATTVVMAGGVAANSYLRYILACTLCANGYEHVNIAFPPPSLCCDNAAMIAWAGLEMFQDGARDLLNIRAIRKWPLDQLLCPPIQTTSVAATPAESSSQPSFSR